MPIKRIARMFIPYYWLQVKFVKDLGLGDKVDGKVLLICMQVCSLVARVCFGPIADVEIVRKNRIFLQQVIFRGILQQISL